MINVTRSNPYVRNSQDYMRGLRVSQHYRTNVDKLESSLMLNGTLVTGEDIFFQLEPTLIIHVCNIAGGFGKGFAAALDKQFPLIKSIYKAQYRANRLFLGATGFHTSNYITICNMYCMPDYNRSGYKDDKCYLDYDALNTCLKNVAEVAEQHNLKIALPYMMGCGNAGGDWTKVVELLDANLPKYTVYKL